MSKPFLAVPTRGAIQWATVKRLEEIHRAMSIEEPILYMPGNLSVAQTRNRIVREFMNTDCDTLVMVDDDVVPSPHFLERVLPLDEYAMVALPHPMPHPRDPRRLVLTVFEHGDEGGYRPVEPEPGLNECDAVATGCVAIKREALEALGPLPFRITDDPDAPVTSDDFLFCQDLNEAGYSIGYWWDGWYADHMTVVSLAPLLEGLTLERSTI